MDGFRQSANRVLLHFDSLRNQALWRTELSPWPDQPREQPFPEPNQVDLDKLDPTRSYLLAEPRRHSLPPSERSGQDIDPCLSSGPWSLQTALGWTEASEVFFIQQVISWIKQELQNGYKARTSKEMGKNPASWNSFAKFQGASKDSAAQPN